MKLSIVLPCHNEQAALGDVLLRLRRQCDLFKLLGHETEIILVNDGSTDDSFKKIIETENFRVIHHDYCRGYGKALQSGISGSRGQFIAFFDADSTYWPEDLPALLAEADGNSMDMVIGERSFFTSGMPLVRAIGNAFFCFLTRRLVGQVLGDMCTGYRIVGRERLTEILALSSEGLHFSIELSLHAITNKWSIRSVPVRYSTRKGTSKLNVITDGFRFLGVILSFRWRSKLRAAPWLSR